MTDGMAKRSIPFGRPTIVGNELAYIAQAIGSGSIAGGGVFTARCERWLEERLGAHRVLLTHSCTGALELAAMLAGVGPGDEVIMPSFTFSSTATAFVLRGATPVFIDIRPDSLNIDEGLIEGAITSRTKVIVPVHYAGLSCDMDAIANIANSHKLLIVEDAAQAHLSSWKGRALGTIGQLGCLSFHETKNIISGEGGALVINDPQLAERAEILREKGTDRSRFFRGEVDKYSWRDIGSSYSPAELISAFLYAQFEHADSIIAKRRHIYQEYLRRLQPLSDAGSLVLPSAPADAANGHIFWILAPDLDSRTAIIGALKAQQIHAVFHYVPLHSAPAGRHFGRTHGDLPVTDDVADRLIRLPVHLGLSDEDIARVVDAIEDAVSANR